MAFNTQLFIVTVALVLILALASLRKITVIPTTQAGAVAAIDQIQEWSKWMAGIQTAAIAGLALMVFKKESFAVEHLPGGAPLFALCGFVFLGAALFCSAWILSALPSHTIRIHAQELPEKTISAVYDIYEQPLFSWLRRIHLGYLLAATHWLWAVGLLSVGLFFVTLLAYGATCA